MLKRMLVIPVTSAALMSMPSVAIASPPDRAENPFVCPVLTLSAQAAESSGRFTSIGDGEYTFAPGAAGSADTFSGNVPNHATNGDGAGSPAGAHAAPGDTGYSAIWSGND